MSLIPLKFLLWRPLWICYGARCVHSIIPSRRRGNYSSWGHRCTHSELHSSKRFKPLSDMIWLCQGYWWIAKNTKEEFSCVMVFIMRPNHTFIFVSGFNECLWTSFFLTQFNLRKFLVLYLGCGCMIFDFTTQMISSHFLPHADEKKKKKLECKDHQIYSKMLRKICKKEV